MNEQMPMAEQPQPPKKKTLEETLAELTPQAPESTKPGGQEEGISQTGLKKMIFEDPEEAEGMEADIEAAVGRIGETAEQKEAREQKEAQEKAAKARQELKEKVALERQVETVSNTVGEALYSKIIELSKDPDFRSKDLNERYNVALDAIRPVVTEDLKRKFPDADEGMLAGQIFHAYASALEELRSATGGQASEAELDTAAKVMKAKESGMASAGKHELGASETGEEIPKEIGTGFASTTSFAGFETPEPTQEDRPSAAGFKLSDLQRAAEESEKKNQSSGRQAAG